MHPVTIVDLIRTQEDGVITVPELRVDNAPFLFSHEMTLEAQGDAESLDCGCWIAITQRRK